MRYLSAFLLSVLLTAQTPPRVGIGGTQTKLSLHEAVQMALRNNLEIEIEKTNQATAVAAIRGARGFLDPILRLTPSGETRNTPTGSVLASSSGKLTENLWTQTASVRKQTAWNGLGFNAGFENTRLSTNNPFTSLNPYTTPRAIFGVTLPLWRDRTIDRDRAELILRRKQADLSDTDFELRVIDVVARVEQAYYDLVAAREDLTVVGESVTLAQDQLDRTKRQIDSGTLAPVELSAAEAELERRKDNYYSSLNTLSTAENNLKQLLAGGREEELWKDELIPTTTERAATPAELGRELRELVQQAIGRRVEFRLINVRKEMNQVDRELALNQRKPLVQLNGNYYSAGLAGTLLTSQNPFSAFNQVLVDRINELSKPSGLPTIVLAGGGVPSDFVGGFGQSLSNLFSGRYQGFQGGVNFEFNFRNSAAEAGLAQTVIAERRLQLQRRQQEQSIEAQMRNTLQAIETTQQRMRAAEASARAAKEKLDSEVRLFQTGESTNFLVLTRQNEFSDARRRAVLATLEFNKNVARLSLARGTTLESHQIILK